MKFIDDLIFPIRDSGERYSRFPNSRSVFTEILYCFFNPSYFLWRYKHDVIPTLKYKGGVGEERGWLKLKIKIFGCGDCHSLVSRGNGLECKWCDFVDKVC